MKETKGKIHPAIPEIKDDLDKRKITRRDFLRYATLLGMSAAAAGQMIGLTWPKKVFAAQPKRGGRLRIAAPVQKVTHPAQFSWLTPSNQMRQVSEYLTFTDGKNITHPYLLKDWAVSDDLKTWTLNLREGIKFNNGDLFTSDDVVFTLNQWLNKDVGSSILGLMAYLDPTGIEKVDKYQVKLNLNTPELAVPEHLFHYPALILNHKTFEGDFVKRPHGTGPYTLEEHLVGERVVLKARKDYWQKGADGQPLPYMDGMLVTDMGQEMAPQIAALQEGEVDFLDLADAGGTEVYQALKDNADISIQPTPTAATYVLRMRVDMKPWDDNKVRTALKLCQHHEKILSLAYFGQGYEGQDFHVYPLHPEYCEMPVPKYDPKRAKQLLKDAGYPDGLDVNLTFGSGWPPIVRYAEILKQDAAPAGFRISLNTMPNSQYWGKWTEVDFGITPWMHRPLGTMVLNLAFTGDDTGKPVPWNETRWVDDEFAKLLTQANGTLDVDKRRTIFCKLQEIQQTRGSIGIPFWRNQWMITRKNVKDVKGHPSLYMHWHDVWLDA